MTVFTLTTKVMKHINTILIMTTFTVFLAACEGGGVNNGVSVTVPPTPPIKFTVMNLQAAPGAGNVTLSWNNPAASIANISINYGITNSSNPIPNSANPRPPIVITNDIQLNTSRTNVQQVITGLTNGQSYTFNVTLALNGTDAGREGAVQSITATPNIFAVEGLAVVAGAGNVTLSWTNPAAQIARIDISYPDTVAGVTRNFPITSSSQLTNGNNVEQVIPGLTNGQSYTFTVSLTLNGTDTGRENPVASTATATPNVFPVIGLEAVLGHESITLSWMNPAVGNNIIAIDISYLDPITNEEENTRITSGAKLNPNIRVEETIPGLTNGQSYTFTVSLTLGGIYAGREGVAPFITATAAVSVIGLRAIPGDRSALLIWTNPGEHIGSISIGYQRGSDSLVDLPPIIDPAKTIRGIEVQEFIDGLDVEGYYNFIVSLTLNGTDAGKATIPQTVTVAIGPDLDGDGLVNFLDVDEDGDGLIEITTADELNQTRHNLQGTSFKATADAAGNDEGCGNGTMAGEDITVCSGYELVANISLAGYNGDNWQPIGRCSTVSSSICTSTTVFFSSTFNGNGYVISNLTITNPTGDYANAVGLFGAIAEGVQLRNVHIRSASITGTNNRNVGLLAGHANGASIINSSAEGTIMVESSGSSIGGLIGRGMDATILSSYVSVGGVIGGTTVGGLVGNGPGSEITSSYASGGIVKGFGTVGGLVGNGPGSEITSSYASIGSVENKNDIVGGLVGDGRGSTITSSYATSMSISGSPNNGGLVGFGVATTKNLVANITNSYWNNETSGVTKTIGSNDLYPEASRSTEGLQNSTNAVPDMIYADWTTETCPDGMTRAWDFGTASEYPALTCTPGGLAAQRP